MAKNNYETHKFFCIRCANEGIPLMRNQGHQHSQFHRKKLYCLNCKAEINHIECKTLDDIYTFKEMFERGDFKDEAEESFLAGRSSCGR